jgi:hypothetical protein
MPFWDPLRGDSRFEKIVASLAPKEPGGDEDGWRFTEWSRREPNDMDGQVERPSERERASQTPYNSPQ